MTCDRPRFSLGGMIAQQIAQDRPAMFRRMMLVGTAPRGGEDIMHLEKPTLATPLNDSTLRGYAVLQKKFLHQTQSSQASGKAFIDRLAQRKRTSNRCRVRMWREPKRLRFANGSIYGHATSPI